MTVVPASLSDSAPAMVPVSVDGPHGAIRLKWHKLRTHFTEAPFKPRNLALGWRLGASFEIDILAAADQRFVVTHDATLGPSTTGRGRVAGMPLAAMAGLFHRDRAGVAGPDAPLLSLAELVAPLRSQPRSPGAAPAARPQAAGGRCALPGGHRRRRGGRRWPGAAQSSSGPHYLDEARHLAAAMPGARLGYDPMRAASRDPGLARDPKRLFRHISAGGKASPSPICGSTSWSRRRRRASRWSPGCSTSASKPTPGPSTPAQSSATPPCARWSKRRCARSQQTLRSKIARRIATLGFS